MGKRRIDVFIIQEKLTSYRIPFFDQLIERKSNFSFTIFSRNINEKEKNKGFQNAIKITEQYIKIRKLKALYPLHVILYFFYRKPKIIVTGVNNNLSIILLIVAKLLNIKYIIWYGGGAKYIEDKANLDLYFKGQTRWKEFKRKTINKLIDGRIVYSNYAKEFLIRNNLYNGNIYVAENSPDTNLLEKLKQDYDNNFSLLESISSQIKPNNELIILSVGRLTKNRGMEPLIYAFQDLIKIYQGIKLIIIGEGENSNNLKKLVKILQIQGIVFIGSVYDPYVLSKYYYLSDIFIIPNLSSLAIKEAMVFENAIITSEYGLEVHAIDDGWNGFIISSANKDDIFEKLKLLVTNKALRKELSENAKKTIATKYNINIMIDSFILALNSLNAE